MQLLKLEKSPSEVKAFYMAIAFTRKKNFENRSTNTEVMILAPLLSFDNISVALKMARNLVA